MADRQLDEYKALNFYKKHSKKKTSGFSKFDVDGEYYFCRYVDDEIALISQSYVGEAGRDNGVESVTKNSKLKARYTFEDRPGGKHGFSLKAGNHQEIAISPDYASRKQAEYMAGRLNGSVKKTSGAKAASAKPAKAKRAPNDEQNYKPLAFYKKHTKGKQKGFESFAVDGQHYFAYFENGKIAMISEGYPTTAAHDVGLASVKKNMKNPDRYKYRGPLKKSGKYDFSLRAGNHKEIARSVWYGSAAAAATGAAYVMGKRKRAAAKPKTAKVVPIAAAATAAAAAPAMAKPAKPVEKVDDYLPCEAYRGHPVNDKINNVAMFKHANGQFYFVLYDEDGDVRLRSEGFQTAKGRDQELSGVLRLKDNPDYYKRIEKGDHYIDVLYDETGREVGRSCLCRKAAPVAAAAPAAAAPIATAAVAEPVAVVKGPGIWGWLKWLLLLLLALLALFFLLKMCKPKPTPMPPALVTCWDGSEAENQNACPTKVTCWDDSFATSQAACPVEPPKVEEPVEPTTYTCWDGSSVTDLASCPAEPSFTCWDGSNARYEADCPVRPVVTKEACSVDNIFEAPFGCDTKTVTRLGDNPEFGDSHALTPSGFCDKLSTQAAVSDFDRRYLNYLARQLGYNNFAEVPNTACSNATLSNGVTGILGFGPEHGLQYSTLNVSDLRDLEAFQITGLNGRTVYFMKTCGNYFYPTN